METIKNYLESMFRNLPNTSEVLKAKNELLQMMEDKYSELIREGKNENEAVATVIAEFGNLDEVSESLGIKSFVNEKTESARSISIDEIKSYLGDLHSSLIFKAIGIGLLICCVTPPVLLGDIFKSDALGVVLMFVFIALGVALLIISGSPMEQWRFMKTERCSISPATTDFVVQEKRGFKGKYNALLCAGVTCCICCVLPPIIIEEIPFVIRDAWCAVLFFAFIAAGVGMLVYCRSLNNAYIKLLRINDEKTIGGSYTSDKDKEPMIHNRTVRIILSVYWQTVTCIYLCISFVTFCWHITWIIWPIAGVVRSLIVNISADEEEI